MAKIAARVKREVVKQAKTQLKESTKVGDEKGVAKAEAALDQLRRRSCLRAREVFGVPACTRTFVPELVLSGRTTQNYCSPECAALALGQREGWRPQSMIDKMLGLNRPVQVPVDAECTKCAGLGEQSPGEKCPACLGSGRVAVSKPQAPEPDSVPVPKRTRAPVPKDSKALADRNDALVKKYGPLRSVKRVITDRGKSKWCELECGHEASVPTKSKAWRCGKCRTAGSQKPSEDKKTKRGLATGKGGAQL